VVVLQLFPDDGGNGTCGCGGAEPHECGFSYGFKWNCEDAAGNPGANCSGQSLTVSFTPLTGPQGGCGCAPGTPTLAQQVRMDIYTDNLPWHPSLAECGSPAVFNFGAPNDCMTFNDPRLTYGAPGPPDFSWPCPS